MGGSGSGNWYRCCSKNTADGLLWLDINWLHRHGYLHPASWAMLSWKRRGEQSGSITLRSEGERLILSYQQRRRYRDDAWEPVEQPVHLTWTPCYYGGRRAWFICPGFGCGRRVGKLYAGGRYFLCRHCYDLAYESQRESRASRLQSKAQDIRRRLGGDPSSLAPFPDKPKWMHWDTYLRLFREYHRLEMLSLTTIAQMAGIAIQRRV